MNIAKEIVNYLDVNPGASISDIAFSIGIEKEDVSVILRNDLKHCVEKDGVFGWYLTEINGQTIKREQLDSESEIDNIKVQPSSGNKDTTNNKKENIQDMKTKEKFSFDSLESVRKKLLDLSGRNTLLNYRHPKASCVRLIDELPDQVYEVLTSGKEFTFVPVPEPTERELIEAGYIEVDQITGSKTALEYPTAEQWAKYLGLDTRYDLPEAIVADEGIDKHQDTKLQTLLYAAELEARLRSIRSKAETAIEESGSNILYLALGFLEWFESRDSDVARMAPLFTLPVRLERSKLDRSQGVYRYTLTLKDDALLTNITFLEKLAHDFGLILPLIDDESSPEVYFQNIKNTILKQQPKWRLRRQASLVLLNFSKQAMYQDLNPDNWPDDSRIDNHELIKMFFGGQTESQTGDGLSYETEHAIDDVDDAHDRFPLIYDADSSQHSALIDAVEGHNLVIEGPPGSGKSQTITNLISACIANGKKVLFVAEKMAALNVVKNRLDKANLGDFCLELHSHKTHKLKILQDLTLRLNKQNEYRSPSSIESDIERYEDLKGKLSAYVQEINSLWGNTGLTVHEILNKATRYREHYGINPDILKIEGIDGKVLTQVKQKELVDQADMLANIYDHVSEQAKDAVIANHFWYGVQNSDLKGYQLEELNSHLNAWTDCLEKMYHYWKGIVKDYHLGINENTSITNIQTFISSLGKLPDLKGNEVLSDIAYISNHNEKFKLMMLEYKRIHEIIDCLSKVIDPGYVNKPESTDILTDCLNVFLELGIDSQITLNQISNDISDLDKLKGLITTNKKQFYQIRISAPVDLKVCFEVTLNGFKEFSILVDLINKLPSELWRHRDELFDNPDLDTLLSQLTSKLKNLTPIHNKLLDEFSLHRLPNSSELITYKEILDNAGIFRFFSSEWRWAKKSVLSLSAKAKPNKKVLLNHLSDLILYVKGIEDIDKLNIKEPVLNELYRGIETPIDRIIVLREWYQSVRSEYGIGFGDRVSIGNALLSLDRNLAISIVDVANHGLLNEVDSSVTILQNITSKYTEFQSIKNDNALLEGENNPVSHLHQSLLSIIRKLTSVVIGSDIKIHEVSSTNDQLITLHRDISRWLKNETTQHFVPGILPLSMRPGEYSEKYYIAANNTSIISDILSGSSALLNSIVNDASSERYNSIRKVLPDLKNYMVNIEKNRDLFQSLGKVEISEWIELSGDEIGNILLRNKSALDNPNWLNTWLDYVRLREKLYSKGLNNIIDGLESEKIQTKELKDILQLVVFHQLAEEIFSEHTYLSQFSGMEQMAIRKKYQEYDRKLMQLQQQKIAFQSSRTNPPVGNSSGKVSTFTETSLIKHEAGKKSRHVAVRSLLKRAGKSIQALKPCFMMSPMSVAQYLEPGQFKFDLVVMDEASQIRPEDALGSIARGSKLVVVGDPKQLPPTTFFSKTLTNEDGDDAVALEESESILESVIPVFKTRRLRWHYRSRHESLIAFSNQNFYDSNLILFPSPFQQSDEFGIRFKRVVRGRFHNRRNVEEAREIVNAVSEQLKNHPDESVGIVAMNSEQQAEIELQLDQLAKDDPLLAEARDMNRSSDEPLFIKNLENVQGDERDVIMISMTYGPELVGSSTMHQRFGPINSAVGWRRLNVLFTRSKKRMHIFSTMSSGHIRARSNSSRGLQALKAFLEYCETGHLNHSVHTGKPADSDFEIAVMRELAKHGYECEPQLGVAGYYLDLAVRDPGQPGRFLMGVECDGATYHSAKSTRDRDRLRQDILENLGWRIRRIWSTDWFKNPQAQIEPIIQELDRLKTPIVDKVDDVLEEVTIPEEVKSSVQESLDFALEDYQNNLKDDFDLKDRLVSFSETVIKKALPDVDDDHRLLRSTMIEAILNHLPCSKAEFLEYIPSYIREGTDVNEAKRFLGDVLEIVADYG